MTFFVPVVDCCLLKGLERRKSKEGDRCMWWLARAAEHEIGNCSSTTATARGKVDVYKDV